MHRRRTIAVLACAAIGSWMPHVLAQQGTTVWRIGFLGNDPSIPLGPAGKAFLEGLREQGFIEGKNLLIEWRFSKGKVDALPGLARELVRLDVDLIVASAAPATLAAKQATQKIPIVTLNTVDPVTMGIVTSLAVPQGNITGLVNDVSTEMTGKRLEMLKDALPKISRVATVSNPDNPSDKLHWATLQRVAPSLGLTLRRFVVRERDEYGTAFKEMAREHCDALLMAPDGLLMANRQLVAALAAEHRLPAMYPFSELPRDAGGLMSYAANRVDIYRRAAGYAARILKGAKPADLPIERPTEYEFVINMRTAKMLGITISPFTLVRADEVIE